MSSTSLTDSERTDARRFCGYAPAGSGRVASLAGAEMDAQGRLEFRMSNLTAAELAIVRRYLGTLNLLEVAIPRAAENLDTDQAAVWTHNKNEIKERLQLLDEWRRRLCGFLAIPPGPGLRGVPISLVI